MSFLGAEAFLRWRRPYYTPDTMREASLEYEATLISRHAFPQMVQAKRWDVESGASINARGYRGPDFAVPKPPGLVRIVVLGGSAAWDTNASDGRDWPHLTELRLHTRGLANVEMINAGTPGHATWDSLGRLYAEMWMFEPDYVLVYHAWNDIKYFSWLSPEQSLLRGYRPARTATGSYLVWNPFIYYSGRIDQWLGHHSQLYVRLRQGAWRSRLGTLGLEGLIPRDDGSGGGQPVGYKDSFGPWGPRQYGLTLRLIADTARNIGAEPLFITQARLAATSNTAADRAKIGLWNYKYAGLSHHALLRGFEEADKALFEAAADKQVRVLDLARMFNGNTPLFTDLVHTTEAGSEAFAAAAADFLASILQEHAVSGIPAPSHDQPLTH